jgi:hypothetical protein
MKHLAPSFIAVIALHMLPAPVLPADAPSAATAQIEALLGEIQSLKDASFIRNGSAYEAKTAVKFLRGKWDSRKSEIATAADFIEKAASFSSTTGKPYLIRFSDGKEVKCGDFLKEKLKKLQSAKP